jgi:hypothetical protein
LDLYYFEKHIIEIDDISLQHLVANYDDADKFNSNELQVFLEIQPFILVYINYGVFINNFQFGSFKSKINKNTCYDAIFNVILGQMTDTNYNLNCVRASEQLLFSFLLQSLNNKLLISEIDDSGSQWYGAYDIFEFFLKNLEKFFVFFGAAKLVGAQTLKKNSRELILILLGWGVSEGFLKKKIQHNGVKKKYAFYCLNIKPLSTYNWVFLDLKIHFTQPKIIEFGQNKYACGRHYLSVTKIFRENIKSDRLFILNNHIILEKLKNIKYYLDEDFYNEIACRLRLKFDLAVGYEIDDIFKKYLSSKKMIFLKHFQKKNSEYYNLIVFFHLKKYRAVFHQPFYLSYFFDFRGRVYSDSVISPIGNRIFRLLYNYGRYTPAELSLYKSKNINRGDVNFNYISIKSNLFDLFPELQNTNVCGKKIISTAFFEMGKLRKAEYMDDLCGRFSEKDFIKIGCEVFNSFVIGGYDYLIDDDFDAYIEIMYFFNIIKNCNAGNFIKHVIYKDATASAIQLMVLLLRGWDYEKYKICNLVNDGY